MLADWRQKPNRICAHGQSDGRLAAETEQELQILLNFCCQSIGIVCQQVLSYFWRQFANIVRYYRLYVSNLLPFRHQRLHALSVEISRRRVSYLDIYFFCFLGFIFNFEFRDLCHSQYFIYHKKLLKRESLIIK